jgi:hypothetical protein
MQGLAVSAEMQQSSCRLIATLLSLLVFELIKARAGLPNNEFPFELTNVSIARQDVQG